LVFQREGFGVFVDTKGNRFIGNWIDDHKTGHGFLLYFDGTCYEGDFEGDAKVGHGRIALLTPLTPLISLNSFRTWIFCSQYGNLLFLSNS
jgi:hypothetical protein